MVARKMDLVTFTKKLSETIFTMCDQHGDFYVAAKRQYLRLDDSDPNKKTFPDLFGGDAATAAEPDDIFLYWLGDWPDACKACLDPGTAEIVATSIYGKADVGRLRDDMERLKAVPEFPKRGMFQDIDALEYPAFLRAVARMDPATKTQRTGRMMVAPASKRAPKVKPAGSRAKARASSHRKSRAQPHQPARN